MNQNTSGTTKKSFWENFKMPNTYVIIFAMIIVSALLTWIIPSGQFDRVVDESTGREIVVEGSYHEVDADPVGVVGVFKAVVQGFDQASSIIFFIIFAYGFVFMLMKNGTFDAMMGVIIRKFDSKTHLMFPVIMILFGLLGTTMGLAEETYGMFPIFIGLAVALGYDAIVGGAIVTLGASTGFAAATLNPFTIGVAQQIADVPMFSGLWFRAICWVIFMTITVTYVYRYALKIKNDPSKSILHGCKLDIPQGLAKEELVKLKMTWRHKACVAVFVITIVALVYGTLVYKWYITEIATLFFIAMVIVGFIGGSNPDEIAANFVEAAKNMMFGALMVGLSRGILVVLQEGMIIDSVIYGMSTVLTKTTGVVSGILMVIVQNILNFFIPSGSGQAAVSMPIMAPLADMVGITRQSAVLAFQFGDGFSNMFWPTSVCMICGLMRIPIDKWYKFVAPLFGLFMIAEVVLMSVAVLIGY